MRPYINHRDSAQARSGRLDTFHPGTNERISDGYVVWDESYRIAWYEIATGKTTRSLTGRTWPHDDIDTTGRLAVYTENDGYDEEVYLLEFIYGSITRLTNDSHN
jgi:hypothetical protein